MLACLVMSTIISHLYRAIIAKDNFLRRGTELIESVPILVTFKEMFVLVAQNVIKQRVT